MNKIYKVMIKEKNGIIESIAYKCNQKDKCCNSKRCGTECQYTLNKECAIDFANEESKEVIEIDVYVDGKFAKKIIEYK